MISFRSGPAFATDQVWVFLLRGEGIKKPKHPGPLKLNGAVSETQPGAPLAGFGCGGRDEAHAGSEETTARRG